MAAPTINHAAAVEAIYRAAASAECWADTLYKLSDHIGGAGAFLIYHRGSNLDGANFLLNARLRDDLVSLYFSRYERNPYSMAFAKAMPGRLYRANQLVDAAAIRRSAFYADILAPQGMDEQLVLAHRGLTRSGSAGGLAFALSNRHLANFDESHARLRRLQPHLERAIDLSLQVGRRLDGDRWLNLMLETSVNAIVLLNPRGGIIRCSRAADDLLRRNDGLKATRSGLVAAIPTESSALMRGIAAAALVSAGHDAALPAALAITRPSGKAPYLLVITPLPPRAFGLWDAVDGGARVMVQVVDDAAKAASKAETLIAAFGLTAAEARVAVAIASGLGAPEAAAALGISQNTVRTHLAHCFDKTGRHSQPALASLVAATPSSIAPTNLPLEPGDPATLPRPIR